MRPKALAFCFFATQGEHIWRHVTAIHIQACPQKWDQQATSSTTGIERRLPIEFYLFLKVSNLRPIRVMFGPVPRHEPIVPCLRPVIHESPFASRKLDRSHGD